MKKAILSVLFVICGTLLSTAQIAFNFKKQNVTWDSLSMSVNGQRIIPVMGEIHYTRVPESEWAREIERMKEGGVTIASTYIFWNQIEETEGKFNWTGPNNLRKFIEICRDQNMAVVLRIGPYCNGEVKKGGLPDWLDDKKCQVRSEDPIFLKYARRLYAEIFKQAKGLQLKDGGPIIGLQLDNEYSGHGSYLMTLKTIAQEVGFDVPFYTHTNWHKMKSPVPDGEIIPINSDYADGFWESGKVEGSGDYYKAFNFKPYKSLYPYFTCELGGGMMSSYSRRIFISPIDVYSIALVKLGSGCNLLGYYMYQGGTNRPSAPAPKETKQKANQKQDRRGPNNMQIISYDYQAPLGEFGQRNASYYQLRPLHLFLQDFGSSLAGMKPYFPQANQPQTQGVDSYLRWTYRTDDSSAYVFVNNYERFRTLSIKRGVTFNVLGVSFPSHGLTIPEETSCIFPVKVKLGNANVDYATAQLVARKGHKYYFQKLDGIETELSINGKIMADVHPTAQPIYKNGETELYLIDKYQAQHLFLEHEQQLMLSPVKFAKVKEFGKLREISNGWMGAQGPTENDFEDAAVYTINLPVEKHNVLLDIEYEGDIARLYADGKLVSDNFYNGRHFQYDLSRLPTNCSKLELRILPIQKSAPILFPRQAVINYGDKQATECVKSINFLASHPITSGSPKIFDFVKGADISGITMDEARGRNYYNEDGEKREGTALMKELGMNTIRLRVWVNPRGKFSTKEDMTVLARRADSLGMAVMVTMHYSDTWADPQHEITPAAWKDIPYNALRDSMALHTTQTMQLLHDNGIYPTYVQIGNETRNGFLWPTGELNINMDKYADLNNVGYDAVKAIFPEAICMIHIDDGYNQPLYDYIFDGLKKYGGKYDMIGMSLYPYWAATKDSTLTAPLITKQCLANIEHLYEKYGKESMIVETGFDAELPDKGYAFLSTLIKKSRATPHCRGVIYWAPEIEAGFGYKLGSFKNNRPTKALKAFSE